MENSAVVEHVKLCISTIPARTEKSQRLAGSEDKVEQIHTLCRPENSSITQSSLWERLYGSLASTKRCPYEEVTFTSCVGLQVRSRSHPASSPPGPEKAPVPIRLASDPPPQELCHCLSQPMQSQGHVVRHPDTHRKKNPPCFCSIAGTQVISDRS